MLIGSTVDKSLFLSLDDIKQEHKRRHHSSSVSDCNFACVNIIHLQLSLLSDEY